MKRLLILPILLLTATLEAATSDRFGNGRGEVPRSSFTASNNDNHVLIASAPTTQQGELGGSIILRAIVVSGVNPSTITFYDSISYAVNVPTVAKVVYNPSITGTAVFIPFNAYISSGLMYDKREGSVADTVFMQIQWDYQSPPSKWSGGQGFTGVGK